ncbi:MAG: CoA transferase [Thermoleophilia bacterium]|nr:CoA transferase [Thermoleophilia bacterium]
MEKPLAGVAVLSCEVQIAGPYCTMMLGDQGADVVKVEQPGSGDVARSVAPILTSERGEQRSGYFLRFNRNKRSLTLNLKSDAGREVFRELARAADVVVENFRPGLLDELGLGYEELSRENPRLVYASISGFGSTPELAGPYSRRPAYDIVAQAMGGVMQTCGQAGGPPTWAGTALGDVVTGMNAAHAISLALFQRERSGRGQRLDVAMYDTIVALSERALTTFSLTGRVLERGREPFMSPWGPFRCSDGWVALVIATERDWERFCQAIERPDLVGREGARSGPERASSMPGWLGEELDAWFLGRTKAEAVETLLAVGLPVGPVQDAKEIFECEQVAARRLLVDVPDPVLGTVRLVGTPFKLSGGMEPVTLPAPLLGEHTDEILGDTLGYDEERIARLREEGVI